MRKVYSSDNYLLIGHMRQVLENNHIRCTVRNEHLIGGAGELPPIEVWPELWVQEDFQFEQAQDLVNAYLEDRSLPRHDWRCPRCGEAIEGQFTDCWSCGTERPHSEHD